MKNKQIARILALLALPLLLVAFAPGCDNSMKPEECDQKRGQAFELLNKAQPCAVDTDCKQSEWPGCERPVNDKTIEAIKPMADAYKAGKCEEKKQECRKPPPVYCKQGLCVHREPGVTAEDEIQIQ